MCTDRSPEVPAASPVRKKFDLQSTFLKLCVLIEARQFLQLLLSVRSLIYRVLFKVMCTDRSPAVPAASPVRKKFDLQSTFLKLCVLIEARKFLQLLLSVRSLIYRVLF